MDEQRFSDFMPDQHKKALRLLHHGLCRMRMCASENPLHAGMMADALHNIPMIISGHYQATEAQLEKIMEDCRSLLEDRSWACPSGQPD